MTAEAHNNVPEIPKLNVPEKILPFPAAENSLTENAEGSGQSSQEIKQQINSELSTAETESEKRAIATSWINKLLEKIKQNKLGTGVIVGLVAIIAALIAVLTSGANAGGENNRPTTEISDPIIIPSDTTAESSGVTIDTTIESSSSTTNTIETAPNKIDYTKAVVNLVEGYSFESLTSEQQTTIKKYEAMSVEEFQALPQEEQLTYAYWILENLTGRIDYIFRNEDEKTKPYYTQNPTTAEDIAKNEAYMITLASAMRIRTDNGLAYDLDNAKKLCVLAYTPTEEHLKDWGAFVDGVATTNEVISNTPISNNIGTIEDFIINKDATEFIISTVYKSNKTQLVPALISGNILESIR